MFEETRNVLLTLLSIIKHKNEEDRNFYIKSLLDFYELELKDELKRTESKTKDIKQNIELLKFVKETAEKELNL